MVARLYWMAPSHPSQAARKMLDLKGLDYRLVDVVLLTQRVHLRLAGFRGGTVPALKLDERRVQGSRQIARVLHELQPEPPLFPPDGELSPICTHASARLRPRGRHESCSRTIQSRCRLSCRPNGSSRSPPAPIWETSRRAGARARGRPALRAAP